MKLEVVCLFFSLIRIGVVSTGLNCYRYTPFVVKTSQGDITERTLATITTKTCKDHEHCSRLQITDAANKTYIALDCLDRNICQYPQSWCQKLTDNVLKSCEITCCDGNLCADTNRTKAVKTKNPTTPKAACSVFTPFQVNIDLREVTEVYSQPETKLCQIDERCGDIILTDRNNGTHKASACLNHIHCQNPDMFCKTLTHATNGTFIDCELKCCYESFCLEDQRSHQTTPKCYEYSSFSLSGDEVKISDNTRHRIKTCKENEVCSRGTFTDRMNNTHLSLDCQPNSVCENPSKVCQYFSKSNPQSPFVQCNIECCVDNLCYAESIPKSSSPLQSTSPPLSTSRSTKPPTVATSSGTTNVQTYTGTILVAAMLFYRCLSISLQ